MRTTARSPSREIAADLNVKISIEVHQGSIADNSTATLHLLDLVGLECVGANPDLGNIYWQYEHPEETSEAAIVARIAHQAAADLLAHDHVAQGADAATPKFGRDSGGPVPLSRLRSLALSLAAERFPRAPNSHLPALTAAALLVSSPRNGTDTETCAPPPATE